MPTRNYSNTAVPTTLAAGCTATDTSISVVALTGYPAAPFLITVDKDLMGKGEAMLVTAVSGTTLTVMRGYDGTTATTHAVDALVSHDHTAIDYREPQERLDALERLVPDFTRHFLFGGF